MDDTNENWIILKKDKYTDLLMEMESLKKIVHENKGSSYYDYLFPVISMIASNQNVILLFLVKRYIPI